jgi:hypothetical protein
MTTFANLFNGTFPLAVVGIFVGLLLLLGFDAYDYRPTSWCRALQNSACRDGHSDVWQVGAVMLSWSGTYLVVVGSPYGLVRLLGRGRLRRFLRWFWRGDEVFND